MRLLRHEVLRARRRRGPLIAITWAALGSLVASVWAPALRSVLGPPHVAALLGALLATLAASWAAVRGVRSAGWILADDVAWITALGSLSVLAGAETAPIGTHAVLFAVALPVLAMRDPSASLVIIACATTALAIVARGLVDPRPTAVLPIAALMFASGIAFVNLVLQSRRLVRALAERDAFRNAYQQAQRSVDDGGDRDDGSAPDELTSLRVPGSTPGPLALSRTVASLLEASRDAPDDESVSSWESIAESLRNTLATVASTAGASLVFEAKLHGLAPPSTRVRSHLVRIVEEAATQTLRHAGSSAMAFRMRRGDGGVVLELEDDGELGEHARSKTTMANLRARLSALGATAELRRGDAGWITRVRVPHDQLN